MTEAEKTTNELAERITQKLMGEITRLFFRVIAAGFILMILINLVSKQ